jgi:hypothetical protein
MNERIRELAEKCYEKHQLLDTYEFNKEKFAELVRADEREACAKAADIEADEWRGSSDGYYAAKNIATAIRARREK